MDHEIDVEVFEKNYGEATGYHWRAKQFAEEGQRPSLVFNVASVALERYLIALCELYGKSPLNHNFSCLMDTAETAVRFPSELKKEILSLDDDIFGICSIDNYYHGVPQPSDSTRVLRLCDEVCQLFDSKRMKAHSGKTFVKV